MVTTDPPDQQNSRDEYKLVFDGYKFFVNIRFLTAAFAMSIQSALLNFYNQTIKENTSMGIAIFGLAMIFWVALVIIERRTIHLFVALLQRGNELEFQLGIPNGFFHRIAEISPRRGKRFQPFVTHTRGLTLVYFGIIVLWIALLVVTLIQKQ